MRAMIGMREFANVKRDWKYISFRFCNIFFSELAIYFAQNWQYILSRFGNIFHWDLLRMHIFNHQSAWLKPSDWMSHCEYTAHFPPSEVWWMQAISYKLTSLGSWPARENSFELKRGELILAQWKRAHLFGGFKWMRGCMCVQSTTGVIKMAIMRCAWAL